MKKITKILILLLSIALIVGAIAVIASADEGQDNVIEFYVGGNKDANVTTYEAALAAVQKGQVGGAEYKIVLLGNLTPTVAWKTADSHVFNVENGEAVTDDGVRRNVTIDLNGYTLDVSGVGEATFQSQRGYRNVTITGSGNIIVGAQRIFSSMSGAQMSIVGTGYGIKMTNKDNYIPWGFVSAGGSGCGFRFENVDMEFHVVNTSNAIASTFLNPGKSNVTFSNCRILIDYVRKAQDTTTTLSSAGGAFMTTCDGGIFKFYNTSIVTSTNGINNSGTGADLKINGVTDKVSVYMENSSLKCVATESVIEYVRECKAAKTNGNYEYAIRAQITSGGWVDGDGNVYLKDSYIGGSYRSIYGYSEVKKNGVVEKTAEQVASAATDPAVLILDGSTIEHVADAHDILGENKTNSGQGLYGSIVYTNYINGSTIKFNAVNLLCGGSGSTATLGATAYNGPAKENGSYAVDLAIGTRVDKKDKISANADIPDGAYFYQHTDGYHYVVDDEYKAKLIAEAAATVTTDHKNDGAGFVRFAGIKSTGYVDGFANVVTWTMPTADMVAGTDYTVGKFDNGDTATWTFTEDGKVSVNNTPYWSLLGTTTYNTGLNTNPSKYKVLVYSLDMKPSSDCIPLEYIIAGNKNDTGGTNYAWNSKMLRSDGTISGTSFLPNQWNNITFVMDIGMAGVQVNVFINGELYDSKTNTEVRGIKGLRIQYLPALIEQGASISTKNVYSDAYADYVGGSFKATDYLDASYNPAGETFAVGNATFTNLDEALTYAASKKSYVNVISNVVPKHALKATVEGYVYVGNTGAVITAGDYSKVEAVADGAYKVSEVESYNVNFVVGDDTYTSTIVAGGKLTLPSGLNVGDFQLNAGAYTFRGWSTTFVDYNGKTAEEYNAAVDEITVIGKDEITNVEVTEAVTYYPVYEVIEIAFSIKSNPGEFFFGSDADFMLELCKLAANYNTTIVTLYKDILVEKDYVDWKGTTPNYTDLDRRNANLPEGTDPYPAYNAQGHAYTGWDNNKNVPSYDGDQFVRTSIIIDLNNHTLNVNRDKIGINNNVFSIARGNVQFKNGNIVETSANPAPVNGNLVNVHMGTAFLKMDNVNYTGMRVATSTDAAGHHPYIVINNCVFTSTTANTPLFRVASGGTDPAHKEFVATGCVFYSDYAFAEGTPNSSVNEFNSCTFIVSKPTVCPIATHVKDGQFDAVILNDCKVNGVVNYCVINGNTEVYGVGNGVSTTDAGMIIVVKEGTFEHGGKTYEVKYGLVSSASVTEYAFVDWNGDDLAIVRVTSGQNIDVFAYAPKLEDLPINAALKAVVAGWEFDGLNYVPVAKVTYTDAFLNGGAFVNLALTSGFDVHFYVAVEYYDLLDEATKATLSEETITIGETEYYYCLEPIARDANAAYTAAEFTIGIDAGDFGVKNATYSVSIAQYIEAALALTEGPDQQLCYYIAAYLKDAYAYFTNKDNEVGTTFAQLTEKYSDLAANVERPTLNTNYSDLVALEAIGLDLTSIPSFYIEASVGGTVTFAGETYTLVAGEVLNVKADAKVFYKNITISLDDGTVGTYCLGNYVANTEAASEDAKLVALVGSFYNYILFASKN